MILLDNLSRQQRRVVKWVVLRDMRGFGISHLNPFFVKFLIGLTDWGQANYPEQLEVLIIIHVPPLFLTAYSWFKSLAGAFFY